MSKDRKKLLHIHSSVNDKQPTPATLELGELGVNNAKGNAFISTKNSNGEVVRFSEDETIIGWMEQKEVFPYEGYMRGADNSQVDGVTEQDLLDNKSNLIIKLNQVVPENTDYSPYDEKVNGAKDIYGNLINPISSGYYKDGAGLAIDMSKYAMIGANPSFSSITTTCHSTLNGTTEIKGKGDGCGSKFTVEVANACIDATDTLNEYGVNHSNFGTSCDGTKISNDTTLKGKKIFIDSPSGDLTVDIQACSHISGRTNDFVIRECQDNGGKVEIDTTDIDVSASTTDVKSCDLIKLESRNIILTDGDCGNGEITLESNDICLAGNEKTNVYGANTNIGLDCDDSSISTNSRVFGKGTLITTKEIPDTYPVQNNIEIVAAQDIKEDADRDITIYANNILCESGKTVSVFAGEGGKLTIGGNSCDGNTDGTYPITYVRRPKAGTCDIHATTIDDALDEVYNRSRISLTSTAHTDSSTGSNYSYTEYTLHQDTGTCDVAIPFTVKETIVAMSAETYPASSELLKKYTLWQYVGNERKEIGEINIPKDHILKDVSIVNGHFNGDTFTPCPAGDNTCSWYIKLVWNVFDPSTGHADDKITYLPADDFVKDYEFHDSPAIDFTQWYDGQKNHVSADTTIRIMSNDGQTERKYDKANAVHTLSAYTLNSVSGDVKTANVSTNWTYDPFKEKVIITAATDASHINRKTVSWSYGDVKNASGASYDPGDGTVNTFGDTRKMSFVIPQSVDNINRGKLTYTHNGFSGTFDPATDTAFTSPHSALTVNYGVTCSSPEAVNKTYDTSEAKTIVIPKTISDITGGAIKLNECSGNCITVTSDICMEDNTIAARAFYSKSDESLKENIESINDQDISKVNNVYFKSFNFKDDETKTKTYGVIAQSVKASGLDNIVHKDESGTLNVDYISLLILKIASLEQKIEMLRNELNSHKFYGK